jgi:hypothetical protein
MAEPTWWIQYGRQLATIFVVLSSPFLKLFGIYGFLGLLNTNPRLKIQNSKWRNQYGSQPATIFVLFLSLKKFFLF